MQAFVPSFYLTPIKDEEAESQRKAKSRHARQTRRSTQGVTLADLKEAQRTCSMSHQDREEEGGAVGDRTCVRRGLTDDSREQDGLTEPTKTTKLVLKRNKKDEEGNIESTLEALSGSPDLSYLTISGSCDFLNKNFFKVDSFSSLWFVCSLAGCHTELPKVGVSREKQEAGV
ncbi:protein phosphatase 1 regulatory subunit 12A-like [Nematolebias whitei]|uniref:protein phosphatase 1 regulatory subunit 12A-like n=1 Tax=Nematolebias whitei TaxID=451745 RepID=UPI0018987037|nr:protein phosphatase 1 regulatory subunit 12A-like [Nematolebias whitei]